MALIDEVINWNRREDGTSDIGNDLILSGPDTRVPVKFNDGFRSTASGNYEKFADTGFNPNNFALGLWVKPDITITNGSVPGVGDREGWFSWQKSTPDTVWFDTNEVTHGTRLMIRVGGVQTIYTIRTGFNLTAGQLYYVLVAHNRAGIDGAETVQVWLDGLKVFSSTTIVGNQTLTGGDIWYNNIEIASVRYFRGSQDNNKLYKNVTAQLITAIHANRFNEDFPSALPVIIPARANLFTDRVFILDEFQDIYKLGHIENLQSIEENKTFQRDKLVINEIEQTVNNQSNFYSVANPLSIFSGVAWKFKPFKRFDKNGELVWNGALLDIVRDHNSKTANIISVDILSQFQEEKIEYESEDWEPPSQAAFNILSALNYPLDNINKDSFDTSTNVYDNNNALIKINFNKSDNINLQSALEDIGTAGCADVYMEKNRINFVVWQPFSGGVKVDLTKKDFIDSPVADSPNENLITEYIINYAGDNEIPAKDSTNNNIGRLSRQANRNGVREFVFNGAPDQQIIIKDLASAVFFGECYIRRTHKNLLTNPEPLTRSEHSISINNENWLDLNTSNTISFGRENWQQKTFNVFSINKDSTNKIINLIEFEIAS